MFTDPVYPNPDRIAYVPAARGWSLPGAPGRLAAALANCIRVYTTVLIDAALLEARALIDQRSEPVEYEPDPFSSEAPFSSELFPRD